MVHGAESARHLEVVPAQYRVGAGRADITPEVGVPLGGYGARHGVSDRVAAPLCCTAFVFDDGSTRACLVTCDLLYVTADIVEAVRREISTRIGIPPGAVLLAATHTHSGPANLTREADGDYVQFVAKRVGDAVQVASTTAEPATVRISTAELRGISLNRRDPAGPIETSLRTIIAEAAADRKAIGVLMNYACHATVLEADNLAISPDFPGAAVSFVENATGATAGYLQGCCGAINPVWIDHTTAEATRIGSVLGSTAARQVFDGVGVTLTRRSVNLSIGDDVDAPPAPLAGDLVSGPLWYGTQAATLRRRAARTVAEIDEEISRAERAVRAETAKAADGSARLAALHAERYSAMTGSPHWRANGSADEVSDTVQISGVGFGTSLALIGLPAEPFLEIGEGIRHRAEVGHLLVCGYTNGMIGYVPSRQAFDHDGYEVGMARYEPGTAERIVDAGAELLRKAAG
ncbi:MAG: hypothetical protein BGO26_11215 [Actinobacteria bacterium 69-20]|jgi:hypothetical protein|nr:neutral/alkaline non-lysosomal ceramidase N-terminal domain-containing protein [Actinomycetota bacterium]OJV26338.1 MAG: hypothetical protein BGO26_11215 [Actinobacteria bacterium 69-20]